ncbi:MAG: outer membrane protein transport protein [Deltaproteobacteria bacterium]|nr:outer membrane protein transport protein [Deltaproteobacteria bacterium]
MLGFWSLVDFWAFVGYTACLTMYFNILRSLLISLGVLCLIAAKILASTADTYGLSSRASATAGLVTFGHPDPFLAYQNPAYLTQAHDLKTSVGFMSAAEFFSPIEGVVTESGVSGKSLEVGNFETNYANLAGLNFGLVFPLRKIFPKISIGTTGFFPFGSLASVNTSENYVPIYALYYNRPKRFSLVSGAAIEPFENFSMGVSGNFYLTSGANTKININEVNSSVSVAMDIQPAVSPIVGARYTWNNWSFDFSYHGALDYQMVLENHSDLGLFGTPVPVVEFLAKSSIFYDPAMIGAGISHLFKNGFQLGIRLDWKNWKRYQTSLSQMIITNPGGMKSSLPDIQFRDVVAPSIGVEVPLWAMLLRAGYRYEPEHVVFQEENSNFIDTPVHVASLGAGRAFGNVTVDLHLQYHYLTPQRVTKSDPEAVGYKGGGYEVGGSLLNYGLTLGTAF